MPSKRNFIKERAIAAVLIIAILMFAARPINTGREPQAMINLDKMNFAFFTHIFDFQMVIDGEINSEAIPQAWEMTHPSSPRFDPSFTELIFVHNKEQAQGFPDNVIVAWPIDHPAAQRVVDRMNMMANRTKEELPRLGSQRWREPISLEDFGLTYPITLEDFVDNWEKVIAVWNALTESERMSLRP